MDFLSVTDLGAAGLAEVLATAAAVKAEPGRVAGRLAGLQGRPLLREALDAHPGVVRGGRPSTWGRCPWC